jgi:uncharacterized alpha-E superfamily protein
VERAENLARIVDVNLNLLLDVPLSVPHQWQPLVAITGDEELFRARYGEATQANVIRFLTFDGAYAGSILASLRAARENARVVREVISSEMWLCVNELYLFVQGAAAQGVADDGLHDFFTRVKTGSHLFLGLMHATMTHGEAFHFGRLGRCLERADKTSRIVDVKCFTLLPRVKDVGIPFENVQWMAVLKSASGYEMYRKKHHSRIEGPEVVAFLLLDPEFPRSARWCITQAEGSLRSFDAREGAEPARRLAELRRDLDRARVSEILDGGLHEFIDTFQGRLNAVGAAITRAYVSGEAETAGPA